MALLLGLDIGTTSIKSVLLDSEQGRIIRSASRATPTLHPRSGWSEHDPQELWLAAAACLREVAAGQPVTALGISSMAEAGVLLDEQDRPIGPIIAWYDRRSEPQAAWIEQQISADELYSITGQRVSPSFGVTKLLWLRDHNPEAVVRGRWWLPVPAYLVFRLCGARAVDYTIAARTLMLDQNQLQWSTRLCEVFGLPETLFPPAFPGDTVVGRLTPPAAEETGLPAETQVVLGGHDHLCSTLAAGAFAPGAMTDSTGSANALLLLLHHFQASPVQGQRGYACYHYILPGRYAFKGGLKAAGSAVEWLARQLSPEHRQPDYARLQSAAALSIGKKAGPLWMPHLIGSGTPEGDRFSRAALIGAQFEHEPADLFRGLLESLAFWTRHNLEEMQALTGEPVESITLTGGVTRLWLLSQLKADVLRRPVRIPQVPESAAAGAALLAGLGTRVFSEAAEASGSLRYDCALFSPDDQRADWYDRMYNEVYRKLYSALKPIHEALQHLEDTDQPADLN